MQSRSEKPQLASRPDGNTASVTSAIGMEESFGRRRARRTSLYTRSVMWITGLVCAAFLLGTLAQAWSNSTLIEQTQKEQQSFNQVQAEHARLQKAEQYYQDPAVIESEARQQLGFVRPGEQPVVIINADNKGQTKIQPPQKKAEVRGYWQNWWQIFFGPPNQTQ